MGTSAEFAGRKRPLAVQAPQEMAAGEAAEPIAELAAAPVTPASQGAYPAPADLLTQAGPHDIRFDFNLGARVTLPPGDWRIRLRDLDSGNILFESENQGAFVTSAKRFYIRFGIEIWRQDERVFAHDYDCTNRDVLILFPVGTLGDVLGWLPYAVRFGRTHGCQLICAMSPLLIALLQPSYPDIRFVSHEELVEQKLQQRVYATYYLGLFFDDAAHIWQPTDFRHVGLHRTAGYILGVDPAEEPPRLTLPDESRPIAEPYVCIAVQSSSHCKHWTNPDGWRSVISFIKAAGYRVICIDQKPVTGGGMVWNHTPHGVEDHTGDKTLAERARYLRHATAFIGLSSGLSWLAWAAGAPVVLISGFTHPTNEFSTPYRVINWHTCNSCWNDVRERFDHTDYLWCPRHAGTTRQFECTRLITAAAVIAVIKRVPAFARDALPA